MGEVARARRQAASILQPLLPHATAQCNTRLAHDKRTHARTQPNRLGCGRACVDWSGGRKPSTYLPPAPAGGALRRGARVVGGPVGAFSFRGLASCTHTHNHRGNQRAIISPRNIRALDLVPLQASRIARRRLSVVAKLDNKMGRPTALLALVLAASFCGAAQAALPLYFMSDRVQVGGGRAGRGKVPAAWRRHGGMARHGPGMSRRHGGMTHFSPGGRAHAPACPTLPPRADTSPPPPPPRPRHPHRTAPSPTCSGPTPARRA